jgi:metallophosphoesterase (TIGR00282 family)
LRILFIGDIVGEAGRRAVKEGLPRVVERFKIDFTIANCENAAGGFGITQALADELFSLGIDVMTSGNHIWDKKEILTYIDKEPRLLRPANYPEGVPGKGSTIVSLSSLGQKIAVLNLSGRIFMHPLDCPFRAAEKEIQQLREKTHIIIIDFHGEATSEKCAFALYVNGKVSAVIGTHTHVQTADERILSEGTAFITDAGMTGAINSVIGMKKDKIIKKFLTHIPYRFETARGPALLSGVIIDSEPRTGKAKAIQRLQISIPS